MMNPNALPQSATLQDFQQFGDDISVQIIMIPLMQCNICKHKDNHKV
jgi:hypothetical protein